MTLHTGQTVLAWLLFGVCLGSGADISCTSPGTVVEGEHVSLTCSYHKNLQSEGQDFYIFRQTNGKEAVIVAICAWEKSSLKCEFQHGYNVIVQGPNVTLNIASAQPEHDGNYSCTTLPPENGMRLVECSLTVTGKTPSTSGKISCFAPTRLSRGQRISATCIFPDSLDADNLVLERYDSSFITKPVGLIRCNRREDSCVVNHDGGEVKTEHNSADGFRLITAKVEQVGHYVCKANKESRLTEMCTMKVDGAAEEPDASDKSLHNLTTPMYAILAFLVLAIISGVGAFLWVQRKKWCKKSPVAHTEEEQQLSTANGHARPSV
ncbi:uncharacterized protein [Littorina saxatilis]|uniref:uncharacterized protein n=1 Tax=Littorina saxatilis TaxID=31220 RepID=UPI0038B55DD2